MVYGGVSLHGAHITPEDLCRSRSGTYVYIPHDSREIVIILNHNIIVWWIMIWALLYCFQILYNTKTTVCCIQNIIYLFRATLTSELNSCVRDENKNRFMEEKK